jgi:Tol biopolymer transport system component
MCWVASAVALSLLVAVEADQYVFGGVARWWKCDSVTISATAPAWSPDGRSIALARPGRCGYQVVVVRLAGGREREVARGVTDGWPDWSPNSRTVIFHDRSGLETVPATGGMVHLVHSDSKDAGGVYSPNGKQIAHINDLSDLPMDDASWLYVMSSNGAHDREIHGEPCNPGTPAWSRANGLIAVECFDGVYVVDPRTAIWRRVATFYFESREKPTWSPNGRCVAFADGDHAIWKVGVHGGKPEKVATTAAQDLGDSPTWSPDGSRIAYSVSSGRLAGLYVVALRSGRTCRLISFPGARLRRSRCD